MILDESPRMSAVLSARILAALLEEYCKLNDHKLSDRIDKFIHDPKHPERFKGDLHYVREIRNFSAHTMLDEGGNVVEVGKEEAKWTLELIGELFEHFIIGPERSKARREQFDKKLKKARRKPIGRPEKDGEN